MGLLNGDSKEKFAAISRTIGLSERSLKTKEEREEAILQLARAMLTEGAEAIELAGSPGLVKGKRVRVVAVILE